jgi:4-amino-4-deoxy-L-arabinose transferase-like glycosyltransferase
MQQKNDKLFHNIPIIFIFVIAFFIRYYNLALFPLNHDEATWSLRSVNNFDKFLGMPLACFQGYIQPFFSYLVFFTKKIFSHPISVVRMPAVIIGVATVVLIYKLAKEMYGQKAGIISALLLCLLPWHVIQSKIGVSLILTPFFGGLIFFTLIKAIHKRSNLWFFLSWIFLGIGSFYTYQASLLFVPIFLAVLFFLRKELYWLKPKIVLLGILTFLIIVYPLAYLYITGQLSQYFGKVYRMYYHDAPFKDTLSEFLIKGIINFKGNISSSFKSFFFTKADILYGQALHFPLLIHHVSFFIILFSIIIFIFRRNISDKIILIWLCLGYIGALSGVRFHAARYSIGILPPLVICIGVFITQIFNYLPSSPPLKKAVLFFTGIVLWLGLISTEVWQLLNYYYTAPFDLEECRFNSYGCKEAAQYLSQISGMKNYEIITDSSMEPLYIYLNYYLFNTTIVDNFYGNPPVQVRKQNKVVYYIIWAPESHPEDFREGQFSWLWKYFKGKYSNSIPVKTIYYPNGLAAIHIFSVKEVKCLN